MRLIIAGGGTGGHLFPGIAVAEEFISRSSSNQVLFVGTSNGIEARAVPSAGYRLELISAAGIRGKGLSSQIRGALLMVKGFMQSRRIIRDFKPDVVLGVGGYASLPMLLAARQQKIATCIHEQNAVPGRTNRLLGKLVDRVFVTVEESAVFFDKAKTLVTGNPLRRQILERSGRGTRDAGSGKSFASPELNLLVFGGSQGARAINRAMVEAAGYLQGFERKLSIVHQTGASGLEEVRKAYIERNLEADVRAFIDDMASAYQQSDLVVCRAGATTIAELTACGKAALFIPFPYAVDDHQRLNAEALVNRGAGFMLLERDLSGKALADKIIDIAGDSECLDRAGEAAFKMARLDAGRIIVDEMTSKAGKG
jgi:UDP-N-acetylglucosamine--N-acetylmuramyl-(pentapeptide) pyrophosphoryl-undecaprenol N-acetylglucosamine transferase